MPAWLTKSDNCTVPTFTKARMISSIVHAWPPAPGPDQTNTGWRTTFFEDSESLEPLTDLHEGSWWTGVRLASPDPNDQFRIKIVDGAGIEIFGTWTQRVSEWRPLPWPIPCSMAKHLGLGLQITSLAEVAPPIVGCKISFHDLPLMDDTARFVFMEGGSGGTLLFWNGEAKIWGTPYDGPAPDWGFPHFIVPPLASLLDGGAGAAAYDQPVTLTSWNMQ